MYVQFVVVALLQQQLRNIIDVLALTRYCCNCRLKKKNFVVVVIIFVVVVVTVNISKQLLFVLYVSCHLSTVFFAQIQDYLLTYIYTL